MRRPATRDKLCSSISRTPSLLSFFRAWIQIALQENTHCAFSSAASVRCIETEMQARLSCVSLPLHQALHEQTEFPSLHFKRCGELLNSVPLTVSKMVERKDTSSTKSTSSGLAVQGSNIKTWQVCKVNLWSVRRSEALMRRPVNLTARLKLKSEHHTEFEEKAYCWAAANACSLYAWMS